MRFDGAGAFVKFVEQVFHAVRKFRDRAKPDRPGGAFERVRRATHFLHQFSIARIAAEPFESRMNELEVLFRLFRVDFEEFGGNVRQFEFRLGNSRQKIVRRSLIGLGFLGDDRGFFAAPR